MKQLRHESCADSSSPYNLNTITLRENKWDTVSTDPDGRLSYLAADTVAGVTLMISAGSVYRQGEKYYLWEKVTDPVLESPRTIEIDRYGSHLHEII